MLGTLPPILGESKHTLNLIHTIPDERIPKKFFVSLPCANLSSAISYYRFNTITHKGSTFAYKFI